MGEESIILEFPELDLEDEVEEWKIEGLETSSPKITLNGDLYIGEYQYTVGDHLIFNQQESTSSQHHLQYYTKSNKKIIFKKAPQSNNTR